MARPKKADNPSPEALGPSGEVAENANDLHFTSDPSQDYEAPPGAIGAFEATETNYAAGGFVDSSPVFSSPDREERQAETPMSEIDRLKAELALVQNCIKTVDKAKEDMLKQKQKLVQKIYDLQPKGREAMSTAKYHQQVTAILTRHKVVNNQTIINAQIQEEISDLKAKAQAKGK
jgi:hypothetical protein